MFKLIYELVFNFEYFLSIYYVLGIKLSAFSTLSWLPLINNPMGLKRITPMLYIYFLY